MREEARSNGEQRRRGWKIGRIRVEARSKAKSERRSWLVGTDCVEKEDVGRDSE